MTVATLHVHNLVSGAHANFCTSVRGHAPHITGSDVEPMVRAHVSAGEHDSDWVSPKNVVYVDQHRVG